jgi:hypothetical protein
MSQFAPSATAVYVIGVVIMLLRLLMASKAGQRLRIAARVIEDSAILAIVRRQSHQLGMKIVPIVATCSRVSVPMVVGIMKPMILLPPALATGMSPDQLAAVLSHELAHLRRFDLFINFLQRLIEAVLFFHPAVWYVSHRMSVERENSCDDMVLANGCDRLTYADALLRMAELCIGSSGHPGLETATALAATGKNPSEFKRRVLRVAGQTGERSPRITPRGLVVLTVVLLSLTMVPWMIQIFGGSAHGLDLQSLSGTSYDRDGEVVYALHTDLHVVAVLIAAPPEGISHYSGRGGASVKPNSPGSLLYFHESSWNSTAVRMEFDTDHPKGVRFIAIDKSGRPQRRQFSLERGRIFYCDASTGTIEQRTTLKDALPPLPNLTRSLGDTIENVMFLIHEKFPPESSAGTLEEQMREVISRFDPDYSKKVDLPSLITNHHIAISPDRESLALVRGQTLYAIESFSGQYQSYEVKERITLLEWVSSSMRVRTEDGEERFYEVRRPRIQFVNEQEAPTSVDYLVEARIGLTGPQKNWLMASRKPNHPLSLVGLAAGTHWLVAGPSRDVFAVTMPLGSRDSNLPQEVALIGNVSTQRTPSGTLRKVRRRLQPLPRIVPKNVIAEASVQKFPNGRELILVKIRNNSGKRIRFSEQDLYLETEVEQRHQEVASPNWTQQFGDTRWSAIEVEHGSEGVIVLDWGLWRSRGLWFGGGSFHDTDPGLRKSPAGKLQVRVHGPGFTTLPIVLTVQGTSNAVASSVPSVSDSNNADRIPQPQAESNSIDGTTLALYRQYIVRIGKIETESVRAAIDLVAIRGSRDAEFRALLRKDFATSRQKEFRKYDTHKLLTLIAAVLHRDGGKRWQSQLAKLSGAASQHPIPQAEFLYQESPLLSDVIKYGRSSDRSQIDAFTFAVRQAHHPQGKPFLMDVLHNPSDSRDAFGSTDKTKGKWPDNVGGSWRDAKFHAAVGLAELGVEDGVRWLFEHARPNEFGLDGTVYFHPHHQVGAGSLRKNCAQALHDVSGIRLDQGRSPVWDTLWRENKTTFVPRPVGLKR